MGRPPCCDKMGVKKGPWTPEEDIILVTYIQEHGPGNWRAVPLKTGLMRCSKSCRLRWTNYLRPGIRRGSFTDQEEKLIIHLQALLGNRWAAIASYLPERTDNDIKNYWNTHLRKKLRRPPQPADHSCGGSSVPGGQYSRSSHLQATGKGQWEMALQTDIHMARRTLSEALTSLEAAGAAGSMADPKQAAACSTSLNGQCQSRPSEVPKQACSPSSAAAYACSAENISRLLQGWMNNGLMPSGGAAADATRSNSDSSQNSSSYTTGRCSGSDSASSKGTHEPITPIIAVPPPPDVHEPLAPFDRRAWSSSTPPPAAGSSDANLLQYDQECKPTPISSLERWLFEDGLAGHGLDALMDLSLQDAELF